MRKNAVAWAALMVATAALVSSRGVLRTAPAAPEIPAEGQKTADELSQAFGAVAEFVKPSVVQISVVRKAGSGRMRSRMVPGPGGEGPHGNVDPKEFEEMLKRFFPNGGRPEREQFGTQEGTGSGFVYDDRGHILTNAHVVQGAEKIAVTFSDGTETSAKVVGADAGSDVAVIKVETTEYRPAKKGTSKDLKVGEWVLALGSPFGLSQTVTSGIVSATDRNEVHINDFEAFIQTDAAINPGNSGGPLVDMEGKVVGINSAIVTANRSNAGVGFAIPIDMAANLADKLIKDGKVNRARLGIQLAPLTPALAKQFGLAAKVRGILINDVVKDSPAAKAGLVQGDVIVNFEGQPVVSVPAFRNQVSTSDIGKTYSLTYLRDGQEKKAQVELAPAEKVVFDIERARANPEAPEVAEAPKAKVDGYGLEVQPLSPELAKQFGYPADSTGLVVSSVKEGSPAEAAGIEAGNLVSKAIVDRKIRPLTELNAFKDLAGKGDEIAVFVQSAQGPGRFVTLAKAKAD